MPFVPNLIVESMADRVCLCQRASNSHPVHSSLRGGRANPGSSDKTQSETRRAICSCLCNIAIMKIITSIVFLKGNPSTIFVAVPARIAVERTAELGLKETGHRENARSAVMRYDDAAMKFEMT